MNAPRLQELILGISILCQEESSMLAEHRYSAVCLKIAIAIESSLTIQPQLTGYQSPHHEGDA